MSEVARILDAVQTGDTPAAERFLPLVHRELRKLASRMMAGEPPGQTLQATALVHEAWLRITAGDGQRWASRQHFFGAAAEAMRRILIERARRRLREKHGGGKERLDVDAVEIAVPTLDEEILSVHEALEKLALLDPRQAQLVKLRSPR